MSSAGSGSGSSGNNNRGKKFTIKPFRTHTPMDNNTAEQVWHQLENAIDEIHNRNASQLSFEELYRNAYNLVLHKHGGLLYDGVTKKISAHLSNVAERVSSTIDEQGLLEAVSESWSDHRMTMVMVRDILMYMDRTYVLQHKLRPVYDLGLGLYREIVWEHHQIQQRCTVLLLESIQRERRGQIVDSSLLEGVLGMLLELGGTAPVTTSSSLSHQQQQQHRHAVPSSSTQHHPTAITNVYERDFESVFLGTTQEFYRVESLDHLSKNTASDYVTKAQSRLAEEYDRAKRYLSPSTEVPLLSIVETELIERHAKSLVDMENSGYAALLAHSDDEDSSRMIQLTNMYDLFVRVPKTVEYLREALSKSIKADGRALITDQERGAAEPTSFVRGVLTMREKYSNVVEQAFRREKKSQKKLKESFEDFLNQDSRAASCLAVYVDELLRSGLRGADESRTDGELHKVILVFRYLQDKDVFESFYKQHLAKRLLGGRSVSDEAERAMVGQLKAECGYQFTSKLEGMFNDMRISRDTRDAYRRYQKSHSSVGSSGGDGSGAAAAAAAGGAAGSSSTTTTTTSSATAEVDIEVDVLTTGYWPSQNVPQCTLPPEVQLAMERFSTFYLQKHTGRKLSWQTSTGSAEVRATFGGGGTGGGGGGGGKIRKHDLCVTTYQMCILMLFNESNTHTLTTIRERTCVPDAELRRHLISLCTPKHRVLRKASRGKVITEDDSFTFNRDFTSKLKRVKIPLVSMKETITDGSGTGGGGKGGKDGIGGIGGAGGGNAGDGNNAAGGGAILPPHVEEDRRHLVEAVLMRIMKARKMLHHNELIGEVTKQLSVRFVPSPTFVKKRIESLIERDYLERSEDDRRKYCYVA